MSKKRGLKPRLCHCGGRSFPSREMSSPILPSVWPPPENGLMFDLYNARRVAARGAGGSMLMSLWRPFRGSP